MSNRKTLPWTSHDCCGSRTRNRHHFTCPTRQPRERTLPSDLQIRIWGFKKLGYTSGDIFEVLVEAFPDLTLGDVNKLYV